MRTWLRDAAVDVPARVAATPLEGVDDAVVVGVADRVRVGAEGPGDAGATDAGPTEPRARPAALGIPSAAWVSRSGAKPTTSADAVTTPAAVVTTTGPGDAVCCACPSIQFRKGAGGIANLQVVPRVGHFCGFVGCGVGMTPLPGLVRVGTGAAGGRRRGGRRGRCRGVGIRPGRCRREWSGSAPGTTTTTGAGVAVHGAWAPYRRAGVAGFDGGPDRGRGAHRAPRRRPTRCRLSRSRPPSRAPRRGRDRASALCRPIVRVFHRDGPDPSPMAAWAGERAAEAGRQPRPRDDRRVPRLRQGGLGPPAQPGQRPVAGRGPRRRAPGGAQRRLPQAAADRPRRRPEGAQQRHRLRVPPAHRVRLAHRARRRPRAGRRARARAGRGRRRRGIRSRGGALLPPARRPRQRRVLRRRPLRRVLGRRPPDPRRRRARARADRPPHRRARRRGGQGRR